jgi:hypothetical protein
MDDDGEQFNSEGEADSSGEDSDEDAPVAFPAVSLWMATMLLQDEADLGFLVFMEDQPALALTDQSGPDLLNFVDALEQNPRIQGIILELALRAQAEEGIVGGDGGNNEAIDAHDDNAERILVVPGRRQVEELLVRLFSDVLPNHRSLDGTIKFRKCSSANIELFAAAFPSPNRTRPLRFLHFDDVELQPSCVEAVASMIRRNARIGCVNFVRCGLDAGGCKRICDSVVSNEHLRSLSIWGEIAVDTVVEALGEKSQLRQLLFTADWSVEAFVALIERLKTNTVLKVLVLSAVDAFPSSMPLNLLEDLLTTHNITLQHVAIQQWAGTDDGLAFHPATVPIRALLQRNASLRAADAQLQTQQYSIAPDLLPEAIERVGRVPTLLYRLLRRGNLDALAEQVQGTHGRKRHGQNLRAEI